MIRIGRGIDRVAVREAFARGDASTITYNHVLEEQDIREALAGIKEAGMPRDATPLLAWLAAHPNTPNDALRELFAHGRQPVLVCLAMNARLPEDLRLLLLAHADPDVREHAHHTFSRAARR